MVVFEQANAGWDLINAWLTLNSLPCIEHCFYRLIFRLVVFSIDVPALKKVTQCNKN